MAKHPQITTFNSPLEDAAAPLLPFVQPDSGGNDEHYLGLTMRTSEPFSFWPPQMMKDGRIDSMVALILAKKNHGKTALAKNMAVSMGAYSIGGVPFRITADDHRRNNGVPEYEDLAAFYDSRPIKMDDRLNIFDPKFGLTLSEHMETAVDAYKHGNEGKQLVRHQPFALQAAIHKMFTQHEEDASIEVLVVLLLGIDKVDIQNYYDAVITNILAKRLNADVIPAGLIQEVEKSRDLSGINWIDFKADATFVAQRFLRLLEGDFGKRFGSNNSIADAMAQDAVIIDQSGMNERTTAFMQSFFWRIKKSGQLRRDARFMYHLEVHDENYKLWNYLSYAVAMSDYIKQIRAHPVFLVMLSHRRRDYYSVGEKGSRQRQLATNMFDDVSMWFYGRQDKKSAVEAGENHSLSTGDVAKLQTLKPGEWGVVIGNEQMEFVQVPLTMQTAKLAASNAAVESMLNN